MKRVFKISALVVTFLLILLIIAAIALPFFVKKKLERAINEHTDYTLTIAQVHLGFSDAVLMGVELKPKLSKEAFYKSKGFETDWIKANIGSIKIKGIRWRQVIERKKYTVNYVTISQAQVYVYRDKRFPNPGKYKPLLSSLLREAGFRLIIPEIKMDESDVVYEQVDAKNAPLQISFNKLNAVIRNVVSDPLSMEKDPMMTIEAQAMILDSIDTRVHYSANLLDKRDVFTLSGDIRSFSAMHLNHCIEPSAKARIESGFVNRISFKFTGNEQRSEGTMNLDYRDLKLKVDEEVKQNKLKTLLANVFVKNKDKKQPGQRYTGAIDFERRKDRFIFNYWWNSFKSGIVSSVLKEPALKALEKKKESTERKQADEHKQRKKHR